jgi:hypothetical protein
MSVVHLHLLLNRHEDLATLAFAVTGLAPTAYLGGHIRHSEIRTPAAAEPQSDARLIRP